MKTFVATGLMISLLSFVLNGQTVPIGVLGQEWSTVEIHCLPQGNSYSSSKITVGQDTVFGSSVYQTLWNTASEPPLYYGSLINDTVYGRTWYRYPYADSDGLIYDFSLQPGDTAKLVNQLFGPDTIKLLVTSTDSVWLGERWRERISLTNFELSLQEWWIEGIGSQWGVINAGNSFYSAACGGQELLCFWQNGQQVYQNEAFAVCDFNTAITDLQPKSFLKIGPNPANKLVTLTGVELGSQIVLTDLSGRVIRRSTAIGAKVELSVETLPQGVYLLVVDRPRPTSSILIVSDR
jgi:hypothetical protein